MTTDEGMRALVAELGSAGDLPAGFDSLLARVPREKFIPDRVWVDREPIDRSADPERWLKSVYSDVSIVTQFDDGAAHWPICGDRPTCSASMPSVVVGMLDALRVAEGHSVLDIGTGTGFNAALLSRIVGDQGEVTTVEIDSKVAREAHARLANDPGLWNVKGIVGDATLGAAGDAPFDRVINTMAVPLGRIPYSWVEQTRPGGIIVTPVRADMANGPLVRFTVHGDRTAAGRTLPMGVAFMESRSDRTACTQEDSLDFDRDGTESVTELKPWPVLSTPSSRWALAVALPSCRYDIEPSTTERPYRLAWLRDPVSDSWASVVPMEVDSGRYLVRQAGPRRLWDEAETAYRWWKEQGEPFITKWEWTISPERQTVRLPAVDPGGVLASVTRRGSR